jgi:hypothetical protein
MNSAKNIDLDITNYNYEDLLKLFMMPYDFDENDLKRAKKIVLKMHPDKSQLSPEYFLFFSKAYKTIYSIYEFKNKTQKSEKLEDVKEYKEIVKIVPKKGDENSILLKKFLEENKMNDPKNFNKWFNEQFEKLNDKNDEDPDNKGYGEWLKSEEGLTDEIHVKKEDIGNEFNKRKKDLKSLIKYEGVQEMYANQLGATTLYGEEQGNYSSGLFDSINYQDVRQAHTETIIPISDEDYEQMPKYKNVNDYKHYRDAQSLEPLKESEATKILSNKNKQKEEESTKRAYYYAKEVEKNKEKTNTFWSALKQIGNGYL